MQHILKAPPGPCSDPRARKADKWYPVREDDETIAVMFRAYALCSECSEWFRIHTRLFGCTLSGWMMRLAFMYCFFTLPVSTRSVI